jgi:acetyltransferase
MQQLIETARSHGLQLMEGDVLASNREMLNLVAKLGFSIKPGEGETNMEQVVLRL